MRGNFFDLYLYKVGMNGLLILREINRDSFLEGLKKTNQIARPERVLKIIIKTKECSHRIINFDKTTNFI